MINKANDAFRTISEVSVELEVPPHVLRFWETKFPILRPLKRSGGRRYYRPNDILMIAKIRDLLYTEGFTIKGAQRFLKSKGSPTISEATPSQANNDDALDLLAVQDLLLNARKKLLCIKRRIGI